MGILNKRTISKAKSMLDKNRHKVGDITEKATKQLDKVSKGKTSDLSKKVNKAANSYAQGGANHDYSEMSSKESN